MSIRNMKRGVPNLFKEGTKSHSGLDEAVLRNIESCQQLADMVRTSYGPNGMNKLVINHIGKTYVTSDCMTILKESEIIHPAAKMVILAASMQETEIGDGSNYVIALAGSLLNEAGKLIKMGLHPSEIVQGYTKAGEKALEYFDELTIFEASAQELQTQATLEKGLVAAVAAKQYGQEGILVPLIAEACIAVMPKNVYNFNVDNVRVCKVLGGALHMSQVVKGVVVPHGAKGQVKSLEKANIAVFTCSIGVAEGETKGTVLINNAEELMNFSKSEEKQVEDMIKAVKESGVDCIVTGSSVDDMALHFINKLGMMVIRIPSKFELRRLCRAVGARPLVAMGPVSPKDQGYAASICIREVGGQHITTFSQEEKDETGVATILLRASTHNILNDVDRAIDDGVNVVKAMCKYTPSKFIAGAGACDLEVGRKLIAFSSTTSGLDQYSIKAFGEALEVFPRTLAENAGFDSIETVSALYAAHEKGEVHSGVNIEDGKVMDAKHILDSASTKKQALKLATDAVVTILRVDQIIQARRAGGPKTAPSGGNWDAD